jgi:hypothetical protein
MQRVAPALRGSGSVTQTVTSVAPAAAAAQAIVDAPAAQAIAPAVEATDIEATVDAPAAQAIAPAVEATAPPCLSQVDVDQLVGDVMDVFDHVNTKPDTFLNRLQEAEGPAHPVKRELKTTGKDPDALNAFIIKAWKTKKFIPYKIIPASVKVGACCENDNLVHVISKFQVTIPKMRIVLKDGIKRKRDKFKTVTRIFDGECLHDIPDELFMPGKTKELLVMLKQAAMEFVSATENETSSDEEEYVEMDEESEKLKEHDHREALLVQQEDAAEILQIIEKQGLKDIFDSYVTNSAAHNRRKCADVLVRELAEKHPDFVLLIHRLEEAGFFDNLDGNKDKSWTDSTRHTCSGVDRKTGKPCAKGVSINTDTKGTRELQRATCYKELCGGCFDTDPEKMRFPQGRDRLFCTSCVSEPMDINTIGLASVATMQLREGRFCKETKTANHVHNFMQLLEDGLECLQTCDAGSVTKKGDRFVVVGCLPICRPTDYEKNFVDGVEVLQNRFFIVLYKVPPIIEYGVSTIGKDITLTYFFTHFNGVMDKDSKLYSLVPEGGYVLETAAYACPLCIKQEVAHPTQDCDEHGPRYEELRLATENAYKLQMNLKMHTHGNKYVQLKTALFRAVDTPRFNWNFLIAPRKVVVHTWDNADDDVMQDDSDQETEDVVPTGTEETEAEEMVDDNEADDEDQRCKDLPYENDD